MNPVTSQSIGRFGNQLFQYCHARAFAEHNDCELRLPAWVGEEIFDLPPVPRPDGSEEILGGYRQRQEDLIYTRKQVKEWLRFKPVVAADLLRLIPVEPNAAHLRKGDYPGYGYPMVSLDSYKRQFHKLGISSFSVISEERPYYDREFCCARSFLPDFYRLMSAKVLLRGNSSFSWWAAVLSEAVIYSPIIDGLEGGREHDCEFVEGNWPKLSDRDCTDLHLKEA